MPFLGTLAVNPRPHYYDCDDGCEYGDQDSGANDRATQHDDDNEDVSSDWRLPRLW